MAATRAAYGDLVRARGGMTGNEKVADESLPSSREYLPVSSIVSGRVRRRSRYALVRSRLHQSRMPARVAVAHAGSGAGALPTAHTFCATRGFGHACAWRSTSPSCRSWLMDRTHSRRRVAGASLVVAAIVACTPTTPG